MVNRRRLVALVAAALAVTAVVPQAANAAVGTNSGSTNAKYSPPVGSSTTGGSGDPVHGTVRNCSVYASSSSFGMSCLGGDGAVPKTVQEILGKGKPPPTCYDVVIADEDLSQYALTPTDGFKWYNRTCLVGLDTGKSIFDQGAGFSITQRQVAIIDGAPPCKMPFTFQDVYQTSLCVLTLVDNQNQVVNAFDDLSGKIPDISVSTQPSTQVRTRVPTAFVDTADGGTQTQKYSEPNGVTMYAKMDQPTFTVYPLGADGGRKIGCSDPTALIKAGDTPESKPNSCWYTFEKSSNSQPGRLYPFHAEVKWTVYVDGQAFATFTKTEDIKMTVFDVQTLVIGNGR